MVFNPRLTIGLTSGLGNIKVLDRLTVAWPNGSVTILDSVKVDQTLSLSQADGIIIPAKSELKIIASKPLFKDITALKLIDYKHHENDFIDFDRDQLIYHMLSTEGPRMAKGDVNGDGLEDFYIGGAKDQPGALFMQSTDGKFYKTNEKLFLIDKVSEDMGSIFFDADGDKDLDLYVCSGGNEFSSSSTALIDRLYLNDGKGNFTKSSQILPSSVNFESTSTVKNADYDGDGDMDLFVGVRLKSYFYGLPMNGYILKNNGNGIFKDVTQEVAPTLQHLGMITDAVWSDIDNDNDQDLIVVGEYMPVKVFVNEAGKFSDQTISAGLDKSNGWWNRIEYADLDNDGDMDFVIGNHGLNSKFKASFAKPVCMYVNDFDQNGTIEHMICRYNGEKSYPIILRHDLVAQIPTMKKKYLKYETFKNETMKDIFTPEQLKGALELKVFELRSSVIINEGNGKFSIKPLPMEAQFSPVFGIEILDMDNDGFLDIITGGNLFGAKPEVGRYDASYAQLFKGDGKGNFETIPSVRSCLNIHGEVRDILTLKSRKGPLIVFSKNDDSALVYTKE